MGDAPRSDRFDDVYFSAADGPGETVHVFFDGNNLPARWQGQGDEAKRFVIGETGFGTGLNFLLAWDLFNRTAAEDAFLDFVSVEKFPLTAAQIREGLSPWADRLNPFLDKMLAQYPALIPGFHRIVFDNKVALTLVFGDANDILPDVEGQVDAWFLDGFTPAKNPDMWTDNVFRSMARLSHDQTTFSTFTAAGFVKRGLQAAGFSVEKKKGFGWKRDMLAGRFEAGTPRTCTTPDRDIAIMGAGLAGCAAAYVLRQYGFHPVLHDPAGIASGASGNSIGLINPRFTAFRTADSDFYAAGFAHTLRSFYSLVADYTPCGSLHLVTDADKEKRFTRTLQYWGWPEDQMQYLTADEAADVAGTDVLRPALYLPQSARINPYALCHAYAKDIPLKQTGPQQGVKTLYAHAGGMLETFPDLPMHTVRGQITLAKASSLSSALKTNLCYSGYVSAPLDGVHAVGSTFQKWLSDTTIREEDDSDNLQKMAQNVPMLGPLEITGHRAALRTASQDRFPLIGLTQEGALISTAHGSHGIVSSLMGAHILADYLRGGPFSVGKSTLNALAPTRFAVREIRRSGGKTAQD